MTASAISRPGERERPSMKLAQIDWGLTAVLCLIAGAGVAMLFSIAGSDWEPWAFNQALRYGICVLLMLLLGLIGLRFWFAIAYPTYAVAFVLLIAVELFGVVKLGAQRWLDLGFVTLQPSEVMKIGVVLALARFYQGLPAKDASFSWKLLIPAAMIIAPVALVMHQPDLGTSVLILLTGVAVMVLAGLSFKIIAAGVVAAVAAIPPVIMFVLHDYQRERIMTFLNPESDPSGAGYQIVQSKIALGSGGLMGQGYGLGTQSRLNYLPEKHTDFIFATLAEEFGFLGSVAVLMLFAAAIFMSLRIAATSHSHFGRLMASGVTATFALYLLINGAMVMGLAPVVGVPMPLLSYGGTVMLTVMVGFGLVQSVRVHRYDEVGRGKGLI